MKKQLSFPTAVELIQRHIADDFSKQTTIDEGENATGTSISGTFAFTARLSKED